MAVPNSLPHSPVDSWSPSADKVSDWLQRLKEAVERAKSEEPKVRPSEIVEHLRLITRSEDNPILIFQKLKGKNVTMVFERSSDVLNALNVEIFFNELGSNETYVRIGIYDIERLKEKARRERRKDLSL